MLTQFHAATFITPGGRRIGSSPATLATASVFVRQPNAGATNKHGSNFA